MTLNCKYCGAGLKTLQGYQGHLRRHMYDFMKRLTFWSEYQEARNRGYEGSPEDFAWGRVTGQLSFTGKNLLQ